MLHYIKQFYNHLSLLQVMHSKIMRSFCIGSFKLDVGTVYSQPGEPHSDSPSTMGLVMGEISGWSIQ